MKQKFELFFQQKFQTTELFIKEIIVPIFKEAEIDTIDDEIEEYKDRIKAAGFEQMKCISIITPVESNEIYVYDVILKNKNVARARVLIQQLLRTAITTPYTHNFIIFHSEDSDEWRLSYFYKEKNASQITSAKRYTYLVGPGHSCRTIAQNLCKLAESQKKDDDIVAAFSVEELTKEFYNELFAWYEWACAEKTGIVFPLDKRKNNDFHEEMNIKIIRLITRIMFVWFIKQKELVPDCLFDEQTLKDKILKDFDPLSKTNGNYYNAILQNLFFATLNNEIINEKGEKRRFAKSLNTTDLKNLYRYEEMFKINKDEVVNLFASVPFLNGGLFECMDKTKRINGVDKAYYLDCFTRKPENHAVVPNVLFFDKDKGLINILKRYNFTIEENSPNEQQIALDPELLGKVFESLLGTINEETRETARKQSGSFYTPREIVNYMVDESLIAYLGDNEKIRQILSPDYEYNEAESNFYYDIIEKLHKIKILDPACGSGAFPMGILNRIVEIIEKIAPQQNNILTRENIYKLKLHLIENCIYGIDIQPIAVQISKLRFFISLICDCQKDDTKDNFGIQALPNLETKFVCANSLISAEYRNISYNGGIFNELTGTDRELAKLKNELLQIRHDHFLASSINKKKKLREEDEKKRDDISDYLIKSFTEPSVQNIELFRKVIIKKENELKQVVGSCWVEVEEVTDLFGNQKAKKKVDINVMKRKAIELKIKQLQSDIEAEKHKKLPKGFSAAVEQISKWDPYDQTAIAGFFDSEWMFNVEGGFDVVIGNPPYISTKGVSAEEKKHYEKEFGFSDDTYNLFTFKGLSLCKKSGSLNYIIPKTFWTTQTKRNMCDLILSHQINYIFDTANPFEAAMVDTCILQVKNEKCNENHKIRFLDGTADLRNPLVFEPILQKTYVNTQNSVIFKPTELNLRIYELYGEKVKALYDKWWDKIKTSRDIEKNKEELEKYRQSLKPGDVALLGCLTEGGQGLATANNGKYIAVRRSTKWAKNIEESRPKKLAEAIKRYKKIENEFDIEPQTWLKNASEDEIAPKFDALKEKFGRDIFGQGYIYRIIEDDQVADVDLLTEDEKQNGIDTNKKYYVPYDKGDKDGNRWYLETPFAIAWSRENVGFLKTNSGKKGEGMPVVRNPQFYFKEGFCWNNVLMPVLDEGKFIKCRLKSKSVNDVASMSLYSKCEQPNLYFIALLNSSLFYHYLKTIINNTVNLQINDFRLFPIVIPTTEQLSILESLFNEAVLLRKQEQTLTEGANIRSRFLELQKQLDENVELLYGI